MVTLQKPKLTKGCRYRAEQCSLVHDHEIDLVLCANLEALADSLPGLPSTAELRHLTERLQLAAIRWTSSAASDPERMKDGPTGYRLLDAIHAEDVIDALWNYWRRPTPTDAGRLAYMLRALFDGCRRAIVIERLTLGCSQCQYSATD